MPLVSVIIPIYNTEMFLCKCIDSVLTQTLSDIEVLLINDGSTDNSGKICNDYACKDKRIHVIHIPNQGVSHARNKGLEVARGNYISFIDSDDWIEPDMIETLYQLIQAEHVDLSSCGYSIENENGDIIYNIKDIINYTLSRWDAIHSLFHDRYYRYKGNLWDKLYDKKIIDCNQLRFNENIYYNEDRLFTFQYLIHCQLISYTTSSYYHYIIRSSSAMDSFENGYNKQLCTFMDAFDIMTTLSTTFPAGIKRTISIDYIKSSISFYNKYSQNISIGELWNRLIQIKRNNYAYLLLFQKIKYSLYYIKIIIQMRLKRKK